MADFEKAYSIVKSNEGGYSNNPKDNGGETYKGIARKFWPNWAGWLIIDKMKSTGSPLAPDALQKSELLQSGVHVFYKNNFWDILNLDLVTSQVIATEIFDTAVNMGVSTAGKFIQRTLNVSNKGGTIYLDIAIDGKVGPKTILMLNNHPDKKLVLKTFNILQGNKYIELCEADESQEIFYYGWMNRVMEQWVINVIL